MVLLTWNGLRVGVHISGSMHAGTLGTLRGGR